MIPNLTVKDTGYTFILGALCRTSPHLYDIINRSSFTFRDSSNQAFKDIISEWLSKEVFRDDYRIKHNVSIVHLDLV